MQGSGLLCLGLAVPCYCGPLFDAGPISPLSINLPIFRPQTGMPTYSAASGEADIYKSNCEMLAAAGVALPGFTQVVRAGVEVDDCPRVVVDPSFGVTLAQWKSKLVKPADVKLAPGSTLILRGDLKGLRVGSLDLKVWYGIPSIPMSL